MVARTAYVPDRGDVVWVTLSPTEGHEQEGRRPAVVCSSKVYNRVAGLVLLCSVTSVKKEYPFEVPIESKGLRGAILVDQLRSVDWKARHIKYAGTISETSLIEVQKKLRLLIL